jgi:tetratricopeptide (TPR) repeat protein
VQGPRITGSFHGDSAHRILVAQMSGGQRPHTWRVDSEDDAREKPDASAMIAELAFRIFADLSAGDSPNWRATQSFTRGLRAFRSCIRTPKRRVLKLKDAEYEFLRALAEDEDFNLAYYNLGVVYRELEEYAAARVAFERGVKANPERWENYYALALTDYVLSDGESDPRARLRMVVDHCNRVVDTAQDAAALSSAYDLRGLAERHLHVLEGEPSGRSWLGRSVKSRELAVEEGWKALCRSARSRDGSAERRAARRAAGCLRNLAVTYAYEGERSQGRCQTAAYSVSKRLLRRAIALSDSSGDFHFELGQVCAATGDHAEARRQIEAASRIQPDRADLRAWRAALEGVDGSERVVAPTNAVDSPEAGTGDNGAESPLTVLRETQRRVRHDPLNAAPLVQLGRIYFDLEDYAHARVAWEHAMLLAPNDPSIHQLLGVCYWNVAKDSRDNRLRAGALNEAATSFEQAFALYDRDDLDARFVVDYWLGRLYLEMGQYEKSVGHLRRARVLE